MQQQQMLALYVCIAHQWWQELSGGGADAAAHLRDQQACIAGEAALL
jgi:hypothetical protein